MRSFIMKLRPQEKKEEEKKMKLIGLPISTRFLDCHHPPLTTPTTTTATTTTPIPRVITNIQVFTIRTDIRMVHLRQQHHQQNISFQLGIRASNDVNNTYLHDAACRGSSIEVQEAVHRNRELIWRENAQGNLPVHLAVERGHKEVAFYLAGKYPAGSYALNGVNISPLYLAVVAHHNDLVDYMLQELVTDVNVVPNLKQGKSIVHAAIIARNQEMLQTILNHQPDLMSSHDEEGRTPLSYASFNGLLDIVHYFLENFPQSIHTRDSDNSYPIHKACLGGHVEVIQAFHSHLPNSLQFRDHHGRTILHLAAKERGNKLKGVVLYLMGLHESKDLIKMKDADRRTPLDIAKRNKNDEVFDIINQNTR